MPISQIITNISITPKGTRRVKLHPLQTVRKDKFLVSDCSGSSPSNVLTILLDRYGLIDRDNISVYSISVRGKGFYVDQVGIDFFFFREFLMGKVNKKWSI